MKIRWYSRWLLLRLMMFSRNVFCGATKPLRPPGILSSLDDLGSWSLQLSGPCPASGYDDHVLSFSPHVPTSSSLFVIFSFSLVHFYSLFRLSSDSCTRATTNWSTNSLTECHDPRVVHHCGIVRITCRRFHVRLEPVQTSTQTAANPLSNPGGYRTRCSSIATRSANCPVHVRVNPPNED